MANVRIRWRAAGRGAAIVIVALVVLRVVPGLLRAPQPPPLGRDVGLPKASPPPIDPVREVTKQAAQHHKSSRTHRRLPRSTVRARTVPDVPASNAVIGSRRHHRRRSPQNPRHHRAAARPKSSSSKASAERTASPPRAVPGKVAPPPPEALSSPSTEPAPAPPVEPSPAPPATPGDGSQEFAPH
jgi:hypothetical protein